ncbi:MAG: NYN domain-containing protein [Parcubacteria group bacterium]|nr:NYN domain-containing protein [Parcubacteria group bacterium]
MSGFYGNNPAKRGNNQNKTEYIPISELAREFGYEIDHISRLCRQQKIEALRESNGRWHATRASLIAYQTATKQIKQQVASKNLGPRPKSWPIREIAPSSSLRISDRMPGRVNFRTAFKTALKFALLGIFVFFASSSLFAFAKNGDFKNSLKKIGQELAEVMLPRFSLIQDQKQITFTFGNEKFFDFKNLVDELDLALYNFQSFSQNYRANLFDSYLSPILNPVSGFLGRLFKENKTDTAELDKQVEELKKQLSDAHFKISNNERILEEKIKEGLLVQENQVIRETEKEKTITTERRIVTIPSNVETRLVTVERLSQGNEQRFKTIELSLASIDNRFSYTPTILVTSGGGGGINTNTVSNPTTTDSQTVKASNLLDVSGDAQISRSLNVDSGTFYVNPTDNRVGIGTTTLETALEVSGAASISNNLYVLGNLGVGTASPTSKLEVVGRGEFAGTASASYLLTGNTLQVGGFSSVSYSRFGTSTTGHSNYITGSNDLLISGDLETRGTASFGGVASVSGNLFVWGNIGIGTTSIPNQLTVVGSGSFTGQLKATRNPTVAHTGTWPSFTNTNDSTLYINPSSPVADGNVIAYTNGSDPKFVVDAEGDVYAAGNLTLVGTTTQATTAVTGDLTVEGNSRLGDAQTDIIKLSGTIRPRTLTSFPVLIKASASQTVDIFRILDPSDNILLTLDQGIGLLTASSGFNFALGFSTATVSYSRLGTATTGYSSDIDKFNDFLISGALEVDGNSFFDAKASISGNFQTGGRFIFGDNGDTGEINTSNWDISSTGALTGIGAITADGILTVDDRAEFQGTASASYLLTGNTLQVGGFASVAYNRFGTSTTGHANYISTSNDLLISGDLETRGTASFGGVASVSGNFFTYGTNTFSGTGSSSFAGSLSVAKGFLAGANNALVVNANATANTLNIVGANVGVGTTAPLAPFHVLGQCVTGDTRLRRRRKKKNGKYEDDEVAIKNIKPGDEIASLDEKTGKIVYRKVKGLMDMGVKPIYKLTTESGKTIRTTGNHPYFVQTKSGLPKHKPKIGVFIDNSNIFYAQKRAGWKVDFQKVKKSLAETAELKVFNYYSALPDKSDPVYNSTFSYLKRIAGFALLKTKPLKYIEVAKGKYEKKGDMDVEITLDTVRKVNELDIIAVVSGDSDLIALRDFITKERNKKFIFLGFKNGTAWEIKRGKYLEFEKVRKEIEFGVENKTTPELSLGRILLSLLYSRRPSLSSGKWTKVKDIEEGRKIAVADGNKSVWEKIMKIERLPSEQVYDIEVEGTHNFVGNDIVAHNTFLATGSGNVGVGTTSPTSLLTVQGRGEFQGTASASYLLTGNTLQVGGFASAAYSRFGTSTTGHSNYISTTNDLLISGDFEVRGTASFGGNASISGTFTSVNTGSSSFSGSLNVSKGIHGLTDITATGQILSYGTASNSFSGGLEAIKGVHAIGSITAGADLRVNGNTNLNGVFVLGDNGDVGSINTNDWDIGTDGAITGVSFDANGTGNSITNIDNADLTADTLDFTAISDNPTLDASLNISRAGFFIGIGAAPQTVFEVQGTASASYLLTGNTLQVGGFSSAAYSRFGTSTTGHSNYISTTNDVLVSGDLEVRGTVSFGGVASISGRTALNGILYTWPSADGSANQFLKTNGSGALSWGTAGVSSNSLDFDEFVDTMTLDANLTINTPSSRKIGIGSAPSTYFEIQGTASASYLLTGNTLQVGGFASVAYSRFGTSTTSHPNYISTTNDVLVSGDLEVRGTASFGGVASVSGNFFTYGTNIFSGTGSSSFAGSLSIAKGFLAGANNALVVNANATANTLNIVDGNVGIGTTTMVGLLTVPGNNYIAWTTNAGPSANRSWGISNNGNTAGRLDFISSDANDNTLDTIRMSIGGSGGLFLTSAMGTGTGGNYACVDTTTFEILRGNGSACTASSLRFKENIQDLNYGLAEVLQFRPVTFTFKPESNIGPGTKLGFIAEEMQTIIPEVVTLDNDGNVFGLDYPVLTAVLAKAIQEQQANIASLSFRIDELEKKENNILNQDSSAIFDLDVLFSSLLNQFKQIGVIFENGIVRAKEFIADKITAKELCLEEVCVNKEQLKALLEKNQMELISPMSPIGQTEEFLSPTPSLSPTPEPTPTETIEPAPFESPTPTIEPLSSPEPAPSPSPEPEPTPETEPGISAETE